MKNTKNLLKMTPEELKKMSKQEVHNGYKQIIYNMLMDFYIGASQSDPIIETIEELQDFITLWMGKNIKGPNPNWQPGDRGI